MKSYSVKIIPLFILYASGIKAEITVQAPVDLTMPLHAKVYGLAEDKKFMLEAYEKPPYFKSFDGNTIVDTYPSWKYISKARQKELGYVLIGYQDRDTDDVKKAGWHLYDATNNMLIEPPPTPASTAPEAGAKSEPVSTMSKPKVTIKIKAPVVHEPKPDDAKQLLLELNVACTNIPGIALTVDEIEDILPGGKIYGTPIDLIHHKNCSFIAKKYKPDASQPEIREWLDKMYFAILGPGGALDPQIK